MKVHQFYVLKSGRVRIFILKIESPSEILYKFGQNLIFLNTRMELVSICSVDKNFFCPWILVDISKFIDINVIFSFHSDVLTIEPFLV